MSDQHRQFRIVAITDSGKTFSYADTIEDAREVAEAIDGKIQVYIYGFGWTYYSEAMESRND